jgi:hypothetical protein
MRVLVAKLDFLHGHWVENLSVILAVVIQVTQLSFDFITLQVLVGRADEAARVTLPEEFET